LLATRGLLSIDKLEVGAMADQKTGAYQSTGSGRTDQRRRVSVLTRRLTRPGRRLRCAVAG
jgi:hypothetical protein